MKDHAQQRSTFPILAIFVTALLIFDSGMNRAAAGTATWNGGGTPDGLWQNANNWGGVPLNPNDILFFAGATQIQTTNNFPAGTGFNNINFDGSADVFTLFGNGLLLNTFTNGTDSSTPNPGGGSITNLSGNIETISLPLTLSGGRHAITTAGGGQLNIDRPITRNTGAVVLFNPAAGAINLAGAMNTNGMNNILGAWAVYGADWATLDAFSNIVAYTGYTDISGGAIADNPASNVRYTGDTTNIFAVNGTRINSLLTLQGVARTVAISNQMKLGSKGGIYRQGSGVLTVTGGSIVADGGGELTFYDTPFNAGSGNNLNIASVISNDTANAVSVNIIGYVQFSQGTNNSYSGGTYISQGRLQIGRVDVLGTGPVYVYPSGQAFFNANGTYTNDFYIGGVGTPENNGLGAFRINNAARIISGRVTLMGDATIGGVGRISGPITGNGTLSIGRGSSGNGHGVIQVGGAVASDYTGDTIINGSASQAADTLQMLTTFNNILPHGAGKGNVILNAGSATATATFDLAGTTQTINGLTNSANSPANDFVTSSALGGVLILGDNNASSSFGGKLQNALSIVKIGNGTQTFTGANTYTNTTTVNAGTLFFDTGSFPPNSTGIAANGGTLDLSAVTPLSLIPAASMFMTNGAVSLTLPPAGAGITTPTLNVGGATNKINVSAIPAISTYPATFTAIKYTTLNGSFNIGLGTLPTSTGTPFAAFVTNNVANSSVDVVVTAGPTSLKWQGYAGGGPNSTWDIGGTVNWVTFAGGSAVYTDGSFVQFDDSASNSVVSLVQNVGPAGITITNNSLAYTIGGGGKIGGAGGLIKRGSGTAILDNTGVNDFTGDVTISSGTLQFGNNDSGGALPAAAGVTDNGTLIFNRNDTIAVSNLISGTGNVAQNGSGGFVTLSAANTFSGTVSVGSGATLILNNSQALGTTNVGTTVNNGGTLDFGLNAVNIGEESITATGSGVGGGGAIVNNSGSTTFVAQNFTRLTLTGDTTIGGSGRLDLRGNPTTNPNFASLNTGGQPRKLTKVGGNQFTIAGATVDPALGDIEVQAGTLNIQDATTTLGNSASNLTVLAGANLALFAPTNRLNKHFVINDGAGVNNTSGANTIIGPMLLTNSSLSATPYCSFNIGGTSLVLSNVLTGDAILYKVTGAAPLTLMGNSPDFAGGVLLSAGNLILSGVLSNNLGVMVNLGKFTVNGTLLGGPLTNAFGSAIAGAGTVTGTVDAFGNILPGETNSVGTLTVGTLTLQPSATMNYDLTVTNTVGGGSNDLVNVNGDLIVNGNSITINPIGLLLTGVSHSYRLFNYTGTLVWNSDLFVTGPNNYVFTVDTNTPGQVNIVVSGGPPVWNGGSATDSNWSDSANWTGVAITPSTALFFTGNNRLNNTNDTAAGTSYGDLNFNFGAGSFVLNGNPISMGGGVLNNSSVPQTVNLGLNFGTSTTLNGAGGPLVIGGGLTNTANGTTLTLAGSGTISNILANADPNTMTNILSVVSNANWTIVDNSASAPISTLVQIDVNAGTLTFGTAGSAPSLTSTANGNNSRIGISPGVPAVFNMVNGTLTIAARLNTGTAGNTIATINQSGGTLNVQALLQVSDGSAAASSTVNVTGGSLNVGDAGGANNFFLASRGTGVVTIATSGMITCATLDMSRNAAGNTLGSVGVVNLNGGGTLAVSRVGTATGASQAGGTPTATFNFNGGTLIARASSTTFYQGNASTPTLPITSIVKSGGAIIDTTNFNITIAEPLIHDASLGGTQDGGLLKKGAGALTLTAASTYTGNTIVSNGTLALNNGSLGATTVSVFTNAILAGIGTAGTNVIVNAGGAISPGGSNTIGTLTVAGTVTLQAGSTTFLEVNKSLGTKDQLRAAASTATKITYGGTLSVTNLAGTLTSSDTFQLFSATNYAGAFTALAPTNPAPGLAWDTSTLATDGILRLIATVNTTPTNIVTSLNGNQLTLSWPADHTGWRLQVQTNSTSVGLNTNWVDVPGSTAVNSIIVTISPANGSVFYRMIYP